MSGFAVRGEEENLRLTSDVCDDGLGGHRGLGGGLWAGLVCLFVCLFSKPAKERFPASKGNNGGDRANYESPAALILGFFFFFFPFPCLFVSSLKQTQVSFFFSWLFSLTRMFVSLSAGSGHAGQAGSVTHKLSVCLSGQLDIDIASSRGGCGGLRIFSTKSSAKGGKIMI